VTSLRPEDDSTTLFERADQAMYAAKNAGRNRSAAA
jgi:PleD family two-component response regulator